MSFQDLKPSSALELKSYDIDHFGETEKYAGASSMPLSAGTTAIMRARLNLPTLTLSLLKTFPRIIRGYQFTNAAAVVVPMDHVTSARINGQSIGGSVLVLKGDSDCLVYEPEGNLLAIAYFNPFEREIWARLGDGYHLLNPAADVLVSLRRLMSTTLETAANDPGSIRALYGRIGFAVDDSGRRFESNAARAAGNRVRSEWLSSPIDVVGLR